MLSGFWDDFKEWSASPFKADMPASHWFLLIGMVLVFVVLWNIILYHIINALREI